jgi:glycerol-3-phosphate O-acyltransferase
VNRSVEDIMLRELDNNLFYLLKFELFLNDNEKFIRREVKKLLFRGGVKEEGAQRKSVVVLDIA